MPFFKAGDPVWCHLDTGKVPDVVKGQCGQSYCDDHPTEQFYWLVEHVALCGSMLSPRIDPERNILSLLDLTPLSEEPKKELANA